MDDERVAYWSLGTLGIALLIVILVWVTLSMFCAFDVGPYTVTEDTIYGTVAYQVKMERKYGADRVLFATSDKTEMEEFYKRFLESQK